MYGVAYDFRLCILLITEGSNTSTLIVNLPLLLNTINGELVYTSLTSLTSRGIAEIRSNVTNLSDVRNPSRRMAERVNGW